MNGPTNDFPMVETPTSGGARAGGVGPVGRISTPLWVHWLVIAEAQAKTARAHATAEGFDAFHAAMVATAAAAAAIDGMYGSVKRELKLPWSKSNAPRENQIAELLKREFRVGKKGHQWLTDLGWLFDQIRNPAMHHSDEFREPVAHPERDGVEVSVEDANYSPPSAERAVRIANDVVATCLANPKPPMVAWAQTGRTIVNSLAPWLEIPATP